MTTLAYLGTPYTNYGCGRDLAFRHAAALVGRLLKAGVNCFSPIAHSHPVALYAGLDPLNHAFWLAFDELMMARCDTLIVAHMDGWAESKGIAQEIEFFEKAGKPIFDMEPRTLSMVRRRDAQAPEFWSAQA